MTYKPSKRMFRHLKMATQQLINNNHPNNNSSKLQLQEKDKDAHRKLPMDSSTPILCTSATIRSVRSSGVWGITFGRMLGSIVPVNFETFASTRRTNRLFCFRHLSSGPSNDTMPRCGRTDPCMYQALTPQICTYPWVVSTQNGVPQST